MASVSFPVSSSIGFQSTLELIGSIQDSVRICYSQVAQVAMKSIPKTLRSNVELCGRAIERIESAGVHDKRS